MEQTANPSTNYSRQFFFLKCMSVEFGGIWTDVFWWIPADDLLMPFRVKKFELNWIEFDLDPISQSIDKSRDFAYGYDMPRQQHYELILRVLLSLLYVQWKNTSLSIENNGERRLLSMNRLQQQARLFKALGSATISQMIHATGRSWLIPRWPQMHHNRFAGTRPRTNWSPSQIMQEKRPRWLIPLRPHYNIRALLPRNRNWDWSEFYKTTVGIFFG